MGLNSVLIKYVTLSKLWVAFSIFFIGVYCFHPLLSFILTLKPEYKSVFGVPLFILFVVSIYS